MGTTKNTIGRAVQIGSFLAPGRRRIQAVLTHVCRTPGGSGLSLGPVAHDGKSWATPAAECFHLVKAPGPPSDAVDASSSRSERFAELPTEPSRAA